MKSNMMISVPALAVMATLAMAQPAARYSLTDLGPVGNPFSIANSVNNYGLVSGAETDSTGAQHAVVWLNGFMIDISKPGLGGTNSQACCTNDLGQVLVQAETATKDPNKENFCGYGTGLTCVPYLWQFGSITPLATLGGNNAELGSLNNVGQVAGFAENSTRDANCPTTAAQNGTGPQVLDFEPVIWGPARGQIQQLTLLPGDTVGMATWINDFGQAVGISGTCANTVIPGFFAGPHAVLWESDGTVHDLGNLGGTSNLALLAVGNAAAAINNRGEITGLSALTGNTTFHPFLWTKEYGMRDMGVLPGDLVGAGLSINSKGEIVGASISAPGPATGNPRAFLWRNGVMTDLNDLVPANSSLYLLQAFGINDSGEIVGFGATSTGEVHAFTATPVPGGDSDRQGFEPAAHRSITPPVLGESARNLVLRRFGRF